METTEFLTLLEAYVKELFDKHEAYNNQHFPDLQRTFGSYNKFNAELGKRFAKIVNVDGGQTFVHCFVEIATGDIYKSATWSKPAAGVRGNIKNEVKPIFSRDFYRYK